MKDSVKQLWSHSRHLSVSPLLQKKTNIIIKMIEELLFWQISWIISCLNFEKFLEIDCFWWIKIKIKYESKNETCSIGCKLKYQELIPLLYKKPILTNPSLLPAHNLVLTFGTFLRGIHNLNYHDHCCFFPLALNFAQDLVSIAK